MLIEPVKPITILPDRETPPILNYMLVVKYGDSDFANTMERVGNQIASVIADEYAAFGRIANQIYDREVEKEMAIRNGEDTQAITANISDLHQLLETQKLYMKRLVDKEFLTLALRRMVVADCVSHFSTDDYAWLVRRAEWIANGLIDPEFIFVGERLDVCKALMKSGVLSVTCDYGKTPHTFKDRGKEVLVIEPMYNNKTNIQIV